MSVPVAGRIRIQSSAEGPPAAPFRYTATRAGGGVGGGRLIDAAYAPGSILPRAVATCSPLGPEATTSTSAPSFHLPARIDVAESSVTTVSCFPAAAVYRANGRDARSRATRAVSYGDGGGGAPDADDDEAPTPEASAAISASV